MGVIRLLDEHLANQIAAGEVVERPSSVLKELIENAVDAGATTIDVTAEEGGLSLLRIVDNGSGIEPDDLRTAFQRHATSKIATGKDLFQIVTLGFRGEALPSIAAVAKVRCVSASDSSGLGRVLEIEGGAIKIEEDVSAPQGTDMTIRELFFNTPARLKYMRTVQTELSHLSDVIYRQALAHPNIAFTFAHNGTTLVRTQGNGDLRQVAAAIYGTAAAKAMIELSAEHPDYSIDGLVAMPVETRSNRNAITVLVNGRYVRSPAVVQPLLQAYHTLLPINRYPLAVLNLRMHPTLVDVNVHPAKLEVRFSKESELRAFVEQAVKQALGTQAYIPSGSAVRTPKTQTWVQDQIRFQVPPSEPSGVSSAAGGLLANGGELPSAASASTSGVQASASMQAATGTPASRAGSSSAAYEDAAAFESLVRESGNSEASMDRSFESNSPAWPSRQQWPSTPSGRSPSAATSTGRSEWQERSAQPQQRVPEQVWQAAYAAPDAAAKPPEFPELHWIGQMHGTYLIAQNDTGLYLIDQHAAHERINYEFYYEKFGRPEEASQELLLPVTLSFSPDEYIALTSRLQLFEQVGVYLEDFGGNTFIVRAVPHWMPSGDEADIVREMAEWVLAEKNVDLRKLREKASVLCSCKASIKANQALTREAAESLFKRLGECRQPYTCPHGRPIVVSFTTYELEKMFKRVMN
ncbi:DNA mismatch repair endonuclease MutL [Cohnella lubricantis]|uniref:DNA mismatch repair protein MutL n=1 Tax=Cohnella lubricantis TaxID=2163172 RepID=A0A841TM89_9BACL|nr:DNA mismatch repair endonuclease MutL [Cohnella lubricantis]MBB6679641.1 DNA mismatch repair endonuclease MutL [Cohnella lubricantis]MBP2118585.1 DNA mismatch repair protein MutL [Cohnella lubricantis]